MEHRSLYMQRHLFIPGCTAVRYGHVTKRANLGILEQNVASKMSRELEEISQEVDKISAKLETAKIDAKKYPSTLQTKLRKGRSKVTY